MLTITSLMPFVISSQMMQHFNKSGKLTKVSGCFHIEDLSSQSLQHKTLMVHLHI
jgi:hypothetical protein